MGKKIKDLKKSTWLVAKNAVDEELQSFLSYGTKRDGSCNGVYAILTYIWDLMFSDDWTDMASNISDEVICEMYSQLIDLVDATCERSIFWELKPGSDSEYQQSNVRLTTKEMLSYFNTVLRFLHLKGIAPYTLQNGLLATINCELLESIQDRVTIFPLNTRGAAELTVFGERR